MDDANVYAVGEFAQHRGQVYGLVAPLWEQGNIAILVDDDSVLDPYQIQVPGNHNPPKLATLVTTIFAKTTHVGGLDLIPSTLDLMYVALGQSAVKTTPMEERFEKFILECRSNMIL
jgi:hypothetical protein